MSELRDMAEKIHEELLKQANEEVAGMQLDTTCSAQGAFQSEQQEYLSGVFKELVNGGEFVPSEVIRKGLAAFNKIEARAFIIQNVLESVKHGKGLTQTLKEYGKLGLTEVRTEQLTPTADGTQPPNGTFLIRLWNSFKSLAGKIIGIITNAIKLAPEMAGVEPSVGLAGLGFPTISFQIKPESQSFKEIWDILKPAFGAS